MSADAADWYGLREAVEDAAAALAHVLRLMDRLDGQATAAPASALDMMDAAHEPPQVGRRQGHEAG